MILPTNFFKEMTMKMTDEQAKLWLSKQRKAYALGRLSDDQISKMESLVGWDWKLTVDELVDVAIEVYGRAKARGSLPKIDSKDRWERGEAAWLLKLRLAKSEAEYLRK